MVTRWFDGQDRNKQALFRGLFCGGLLLGVAFGNPSRAIKPMQLAQSVRMRQRRINQAQEGVYLPRNRRDAVEAGRFAATGDGEDD